MPAPPDPRIPVPRPPLRPKLLVTSPSRIRLARKAKHLSLRLVASTCGRTAQSMWNLENGVTKSVEEDVAIAVAHFLDLPLEEVFATQPASRASTSESRASTSLGGEPS